MTVNKNLLIDIFSIPQKTVKKQQNSRFDKLEKRAMKKKFILERTYDSYGRYELCSNIHNVGVTGVFQTLDQVEAEIIDIENRY